MTQIALEPVERRKMARRQAQGKVFVLFGQYPSSVGQLLNICREGLCCLIDEAGHLNETREISLIGYGEDNNYTAIRALPLDSLDCQKKRTKKGARQKIRLRFARLNSYQQSQLSSFLSLHTGIAFNGSASVPPWLT
jgi:hypothetical protein